MIRTLALVPARGGSKGVPGKNIRIVGGKPLIAHTLEAAAGSKHLQRTVLSTDDPRIAEIGREFGVEVPFMRPSELASDCSPVIDAAIHLLGRLAEREEYRPDFVMLLQPTSPLRSSDDIDAAIELAAGQKADAVVSLVPSAEHPLLAKKLGPGGRLEQFVESALSEARRQDLPDAYALNGAIYLVRTGLLIEQRNWCPQGAIGYVMPPERSLDIDTEWDLEIADFILGRKARAALLKARSESKVLDDK